MASWLPVVLTVEAVSAWAHASSFMKTSVLQTAEPQDTE